MIYFLEDKISNAIKIGYTKNMKQRFRAHDGSNPNRLIILKTIHGEKELEKLLHFRFNHIRKKKEWFRNTDELKGFISNIDINVQHLKYIKEHDMLFISHLNKWVEDLRFQIPSIFYNGICSYEFE